MSIGIIPKGMVAANDAISALEELVPAVCKEMMSLRDPVENLREREKQLVEQLQVLGVT